MIMLHRRILRIYGHPADWVSGHSDLLLSLFLSAKLTQAFIIDYGAEIANDFRDSFHRLSDWAEGYL